MKTVTIQIGVDEYEDKIGTAIKTDGYKKDSLSHQLELLGIFQNLVSLQQDKIKTLGRQTKKL